MIDRKWIGHELPPVELLVERDRIRLFARAIGEDDPIYQDVEAARLAGHADLPVPPTFLIAAEMDANIVLRVLEMTGVPVKDALHGEQSFRYFSPVVAGDSITVRPKIADIYDKKQGALTFISLRSPAINQRKETVAELCSTIVVRNAAMPA